MLNPQLDLVALAGRFKAKQRLLIDGVFQESVADDLYRCFEKEVPWGATYIGQNRKPVVIPAEKLVTLSRREWAGILNTANTTPAERFQFLYNIYAMVPAYLEKRDPHLVLHRVLEYINGAEFIHFVRTVTGVQSVTNADAQATRYIPGCFLRKHSDYEEGKGREVAYVLNLTRDWYPEFGGLLQFLDEHDDVSDTFSPRFNTMSLFRVPMWHQVSYVVPYATQARYAITGWVRSGKSVIESTNA